MFCDRFRKQYPGTLLLIATCFLSAVSAAQQFGKNKIQYKDFQWNFLQSRYFDVYYYGEGRELAEFTADAAESSYVALEKGLKYSIENRIPILVYNSHNDFEQTNVLYVLLEEGVQGFTEIFKNRVVVAFRGSHDDYRRLLHHELTHAVMNQMMYGGRMGSMISGLARFQLPLWLVEGIAEYQSVGWDSESDMFMRDATISGYLPPISQLYGYLAYKGGQSVLNFIADQYGQEKIGDLFFNLKLYKNFEQGIKKTLGMDEEKLTQKWHKYLRTRYWPDIQGRDEPGDIAIRLTDHKKERARLNNSPYLSPQGDKMVFLSNRSDYIDLYLMDTIEKKIRKRLVKGQRSELFEEVHWTRPGIGWAPQGDRIVMAAKAGSGDALFILDAENGKVLHTYKLALDGIFSPDWSPDGKTIVFMGTQGGQSDLYLFHLNEEKLEPLTNDIFGDWDPVWSPTGDQIAFISDRDRHTGDLDETFRMSDHSYQQKDLYTIDIQTGRIRRHTHDVYREASPAYSPDGNKIAFISDRNGIDNIHICDLETGSIYPITNLISGVSQISWAREKDRIAFSTYYYGGYDLFLLNHPIKIESGSVVLEKTSFMKKTEKEGKESAVQEVSPGEETTSKDYSRFVFDDDFRQGQITLEDSKKRTFLDSLVYKEDGEYKTNTYKIRFSPDVVAGGAGYSQFFGLQGSTMIAFSDILGNHQINLYTDIFYNLKNSNFQLAYYYLPKRTDLGVSLFHYSYLYFTYFYDGTGYYWGYYRDRNYGLTLYLSRPFSRFRRVDFGLTGVVIERDYGVIDPYLAYYYGVTELSDLGNLYKRHLILANIGYKTDTVLWGSTGPVNGTRSSFSFTYSPSISEDYGLDFWTFKGDWRNYWRIHKDFIFVTRLCGGVSGGENPQRFLLGGMRGWFNYRYHQIPDEYWGSGDIFYFSSFETPLRGSLYYQMIGTRFVLTNLEIRFPLIHYLVFGWPLPVGFQNIRGALFMDVGSAWNDDSKWKPFSSNKFGLPVLHDLRAGYGIGARLNLGFFLLKYDIAWGTNLESSDKPIHYFTLGAEF
ncbi:MAG TPA: biopolymer transporter Tol [bacterium]|nr:biopolymer transporter Tol [bacterium]